MLEVDQHHRQPNTSAIAEYIVAAVVANSQRWLRRNLADGVSAYPSTMRKRVDAAASAIAAGVSLPPPSLLVLLLLPLRSQTASSSLSIVVTPYLEMSEISLNEFEKSTCRCCSPHFCRTIFFERRRIARDCAKRGGRHMMMLLSVMRMRRSQRHKAAAGIF